MSTIMEYGLWIERTRVGLSSPRSAPLKEVDKALNAYHMNTSQDKLDKLKKALDDWKTFKKDWKNSKRNKEQVVERLTEQIEKAVSNKPSSPTKEEQEIHSLFEARWRDAAQIIFGKAELRFKSKSNLEKLQTAYGLKKDLQEVHKGTKHIQGYRENTSQSNNSSLISQESRHISRESLISEDIPLSEEARKVSAVMGKHAQQLNGIEIHALNTIAPLFEGVTDEIAKAIGEHIFTNLTWELLTGLTPFVGHVVSAGKMINGAVSTAIEANRSYSAVKHISAFAPGDPTEAAKAINIVLDRIVKREIEKAAIHTGEFTARNAAFFDAGVASGPVIGGACALARLMHKVSYIVRDYNEMRLTNESIRDQKFDTARLFDENPLLGCFFVKHAETSTLVNVLVSEYGTTGAKYEIEFLWRNHIDPMKVQATKILEESRLELLNYNKGKPLTEKDMLNRDIRKGVNLKKVKTSASQGFSHEARHMSAIGNFKKSRLKQTMTTETDPLKRQREIHAALKAVDNRILQATYFNSTVLSRESMPTGLKDLKMTNQFINMEAWKKFSYGSFFGRRTPPTVAVDMALEEYRQHTMGNMQKFGSVATASSRADIQRRLEIIQQRLFYLGNIQDKIERWLVVKDEKSSTTRRPYMMRLQQALLLEQNALNDLNAKYSNLQISVIETDLFT